MKIPTPNSGDQTDNHAGPDRADAWHKTDEEAYRVAELVRDGKSAKEIANLLYRHHGEKELGRVSTLIRHAFARKILDITPPTNPDLERALAAASAARITFHVVNNDHIAQDEASNPPDTFRADAVCRQAAALIAARIQKLLADSAHGPGPVVVANAGGFALSRVVHFLAEQKHPAARADASRLLFLSLNAASLPATFGLNANFLAVRMSEIYGARHLARSPIWPEALEKEYEHALQHLDLLVCGAGSENGLLAVWLKNHADIPLPKDACGDICLLPIKRDGTPARQPASIARRLEDALHPRPGYDQLRQLAKDDRIIYVATGYEHEDRRRDPVAAAVTPHSKLAVTHAVLSQPLTRTCVLGATLARDLLKP